MNKQLAFEIGKEKFYRYPSIQHITTAGRFLHARDDLTLYSTFGLKKENIEVFFTKLKELLNEGQLGASFLIINEFEKQLNLFPEIDLVYRIAARVFFKEGDNLAFDLEPDELTRRVNLFKKKEIVSLLSIQPLQNLLNLAEFLRSDTPSYLIERDQVIRKSHIDLLMMMGTSLSRNGKK